MGEGGSAGSAASRIAHHHSVTSTNTLALQRARHGGRYPIWTLADEQIAGRGRHARKWHSPIGNLYATRIVEALPPMVRITGLAFVAALALHDAVSSLLDAQARHGLMLKWPNDLLAGGAKLAGILIELEAADERIIAAVGIGVNVSAVPHESATSLAALGCHASLDEVFEPLDRAFEARLAEWNGGSGFAAIRAAWLGRALGRGEPTTVRTGGKVICGRFAGLDDDGALLVELDGGAMQRITAGEVVGNGELV